MKAKNKGLFRSDLIAEQKQLRERYHYARDAEKELYTIKRNIDTMFKEPSLQTDKKRQKQESLY